MKTNCFKEREGEKKNIILQQMSNKTIFGLPVDVLSSSNMSFTSSQVDGKYVLKSGDSMSGDLEMEGGAGIDVKDGGNVSVDGQARCKG